MEGESVIGGVALALSPILESTMRPIIKFVRPIPSVALIQIALVTLGLSTRMQLTLIAFRQRLAPAVQHEGQH